MARLRWLVLLLCSLLLHPAVTAATDGDRASTSQLQAGDFTASSLADGATVRLSEFSGRVVLLNFWASWCFPCRAEMPEFQKLYDRFKEDGFTVVAVAVYDKLPDAQAFQDEHEFSFPVLFDHLEEAKQAFNVEVVPQTFLIGRDGLLVPIPNPKTKKSKLRVNDPTIWVQAETVQFLETLIQQ